MTDPEHFLFYSAKVVDGVAHIDPAESRHVFAALRNGPGQSILVTDGRGAIHKCRIGEDAGRESRGMTVEQTTVIPRELPEVRLCVGLPEKDAFEEICGSCAALGVATIVPLLCEFCQKPWWHAWDKQEARMHHKMVAGIKQARSAWLPRLWPPRSLADAIAEGMGCPRLVADETGLPLMDAGGDSPASTIYCFVGPPGGFSPKEIDALGKAGAVGVSLSHHRLRTELAALLLCGFVKNTTRKADNAATV